MVKNYLRIAWRNISRRKENSVINILGLSLGITCVVLIFTMVKYHLTFDNFHPHKERIYRVTTEFHDEAIRHNTGVPFPLGEVFRNDYTVAEKSGRIGYLQKQLVSSSPNIKFEEDIAFADPSIFDILSLPVQQGNKHAVLKERNTAVITEKMAAKYFGAADPIGQVIHLNDSLHFRITGILRNLPVNSDFQQQIYLPFDNLKDCNPGMVEENWWWSVSKDMQCFVLLKPGVSPAFVDDKALADISKRFYPADAAKMFRFKLQPLSDIHFNPDLNGVIEKKNLWALVLIGALLIITTCINFVTLSIAQTSSRSKEVGVRKVLGSLRGQVFFQFIMETALMVFVAMIAAFILSQLVLPYMNELFDAQLQVNILHDTSLLLFLAGIFVMVVFFSGAYPGLILAGIQPILALKNKLIQKELGGFSLRKTLIIIQFAISQILIISTIVIADQIRYSKLADLGFRKEAVVMLPLPDNTKSKLSTLRSLLSQVPGVEKFTFASDAPVSAFNPSTGIQFDSRTIPEKFPINGKAGDDQYVSAFGLQLLAGRNLFQSDTIREYLINETTVKKLRLTSNEEVIGKKASINGIPGLIVGVVKDFHNRSFHSAIDPLYITTLSQNYSNCAVKINMANLGSVMQSIEKAWREVYPSYIYKYSFLDERIEQFYKADNTIFRLIQIFTGISLIIGCFGLYGLVSFMAAQKTKEIAIRKTLGASVKNIIWLFGRQFMQMLLIAFAIAAPIAWLAMNNWLDNFVYRVTLGPWIFVLAILTSLSIAGVTVGYKSIKAAVMNPVRALKSE